MTRPTNDDHRHLIPRPEPGESLEAFETRVCLAVCWFWLREARQCRVGGQRRMAAHALACAAKWRRRLEARRELLAERRLVPAPDLLIQRAINAGRIAHAS